jgi:hypothetical protein
MKMMRLWKRKTTHMEMTSSEKEHSLLFDGLEL